MSYDAQVKRTLALWIIKNPVEAGLDVRPSLLGAVRHEVRIRCNSVDSAGIGASLSALLRSASKFNEASSALLAARSESV
ncbi:uncharacterized protein PHALS_00050 [Plasmopara halstedii]|uniref:Uncharacterized protein n=1 Tax=Plasmopara halstedii TaxID=4781 RepID=A0A0P1A6F3_PLAHL|nr:uncharacterized protein PHALS_00050 [Plasmopara halstedii]CEG35713.1 hypothetical protein PHALS_00050 [Plasmopara halstedii]|eukprot:XP_024572082.1 hypothetical protein PHALS_00050 [Plasmopara halstedii]